MATPSRRPVMFPDLPDWLASPWTALLPFTAGQTFRVEDFVQDNGYVIRAELRWVRLPVRVDPDDVTARYEKGILEIGVSAPAVKPAGSRVAIEKAD